MTAAVIHLIFAGYAKGAQEVRSVQPSHVGEAFSRAMRRVMQSLNRTSNSLRPRFAAAIATSWAVPVAAAAASAAAAIPGPVSSCVPAPPPPPAATACVALSPMPPAPTATSAPAPPPPAAVVPPPPGPAPPPPASFAAPRRLRCTGRRARLPNSSSSASWSGPVAAPPALAVLKD